jgi:hypothetical protein
MPKPKTTQDDAASPDPFVVDSEVKGDTTPTQELNRDEIPPTLMKHDDAPGKEVSGKVEEAGMTDATGTDAAAAGGGGSAASWGGQDMPSLPSPPPPAPSTPSHFTNERGAQTSVLQVSDWIASMVMGIAMLT